jgi:hypothetical protein
MRSYPDDDEWDDSDDSPIEDDDIDSDDGEPTVACPYCRREIHEDSQRCPYCEQFVSAEDAPPARKPWWIIIGAVICLWVAFRWIVG